MPKQVLVIGELNVDLIVSGLERFPALGDEIIAGRVERVLGSSSAICAAGLARLGASVDLVSKVGADADGDLVINQLRMLGVGTEYVVGSRGIQTGVTISLPFHEERALITYPGCISRLRLEDIDLSILRRYQHLHVGSYFLQTALQPGLPRLFKRAKRTGLSVSLDPGSDPEGQWQDTALISLLDQVDLLLLNESEARAIGGTDDVESALRELSQHARQVVVKCGAAGAVTLEEGCVLHIPGYRVQAIDTTGAGDSFDAGFIYARVLHKMPLREALEFANACGALATTGLGGTAAQATEKQVTQFLEKEHRTQLTHSPN